MKPIRNSAKAIIVRNNAILTISKIDHHGTYYILPGGGQHHGESLIEAVKRECYEELGIHVKVGDVRFIRDYISDHHEFAEFDKGVHQLEIMFECTIENNEQPRIGQIPDVDQTGVEWLPLLTLENFRLYPRAIIPMLKVFNLINMPIYMGDVN